MSFFAAFRRTQMHGLMFDAQNAIDLVANQIIQRDFHRAVETAEQAISQYPSCGALHELSGLSWFGIGKLNKAVSRLEAATSIKPLTTVSQLKLAIGYWRLGHREAATAIANFLGSRFLEGKLEPSASSPLVLCLAELERYALAARICETLYDKDQTDADACYGIAWYRSLEGHDLRGQLVWLQKAVDLAPHNARYRITLGFTLLDASDIHSAVATFLEFDALVIRQIHCRSCLSGIISLLSLYDSPESDVVIQMRKQLNQVNRFENEMEK